MAIWLNPIGDSWAFFSSIGDLTEKNLSKRLTVISFNRKLKKNLIFLSNHRVNKINLECLVTLISVVRNWFDSVHIHFSSKKGGIKSSEKKSNLLWDFVTLSSFVAFLENSQSFENPIFKNPAKLIYFMYFSTFQLWRGI